MSIPTQEKSFFDQVLGPGNEPDESHVPVMSDVPPVAEPAFAPPPSPPSQLSMEDMVDYGINYQGRSEALHTTALITKLEGDIRNALPEEVRTVREEHKPVTLTDHQRRLLETGQASYTRDSFDAYAKVRQRLEDDQNVRTFVETNFARVFELKDGSPERTRLLDEILRVYDDARGYLVKTSLDSAYADYRKQNSDLSFLPKPEDVLATAQKHHKAIEQFRQEQAEAARLLAEQKKEVAERISKIHKDGREDMAEWFDRSKLAKRKDILEQLNDPNLHQHPDEELKLIEEIAAEYDKAHPRSALSNVVGLPAREKPNRASSSNTTPAALLEGAARLAGKFAAEHPKATATALAVGVVASGTPIILPNQGVVINTSPTSTALPSDVLVYHPVDATKLAASVFDFDKSTPLTHPEVQEKIRAIEHEMNKLAAKHPYSNLEGNPQAEKVIAAVDIAVRALHVEAKAPSTKNTQVDEDIAAGFGQLAKVAARNPAVLTSTLREALKPRDSVMQALQTEAKKNLFPEGSALYSPEDQDSIAAIVARVQLATVGDNTEAGNALVAYAVHTIHNVVQAATSSPNTSPVTPDSSAPQVNTAPATPDPGPSSSDKPDSPLPVEPAPLPAMPLSGQNSGGSSTGSSASTEAAPAPSAPGASGEANGNASADTPASTPPAPAVVVPNLYAAAQPASPDSSPEKSGSGANDATASAVGMVAVSGTGVTPVNPNTDPSQSASSTPSASSAPTTPPPGEASPAPSTARPNAPPTAPPPSEAPSTPANSKTSTAPTPHFSHEKKNRPDIDPNEFIAFITAEADQESSFHWNLLDNPWNCSGGLQESNSMWNHRDGVEQAGQAPEADQISVAVAHFKEYYQKFGGDWKKMAIAWYAGPGFEEQGIDLNARQNNGQYPSLNEYGDSVVKLMKQYLTNPQEIPADIIQNMATHGYVANWPQAASTPQSMNASIQKKIDKIDNTIVRIADGRLVKHIVEQPLNCDAGNTSAPGSCGPEIDKVTQGHLEYWCADERSWIMMKAGIPMTNGISGWRQPSVRLLAKWYAQDQRYFTKSSTQFSPKPGDAVFFGNMDHVGTVIAVNGDTITTEEGNTTIGNRTDNGNGVASHTYNYKTDPWVTGFGTIVNVPSQN